MIVEKRIFKPMLHIFVFMQLQCGYFSNRRLTIGKRSAAIRRLQATKNRVRATPSARFYLRHILAACERKARVRMLFMALRSLIRQPKRRQP